MSMDGPVVQRAAGEAEGTGRGGGSASEVGPARGSSDASSGESSTPLTNRGWFSARNLISESKRQVEFHVDYLRITAFCGVERALELVASGLIEPAGLEAGWIDNGAGARWEQIISGRGPVEVLKPRPSPTTTRDYVCVEIKGEGCTYFGDSRLRGLLTYLSAQGVEWRGKRVDPCWDHVGFDAVTLYETVRAGNLNSRCFDAESRDIWENAEGRTCYVRKRRGEKTQMIRLYDRRGYNRFEFQFQGAWAELLARELEHYDVDQWSKRSLVQVRGSVDFVDSKSNKQLCRCDLLPWWSEFIGDVSKKLIRLPGKKTPMKITAVGRAESAFIRAARVLTAVGRVAGWKYVRDRLEHYADRRWGPDDDVYLAELEDIKFALPGFENADGESPF